ncbi:MAG: hypothetical protein PUB98_05450 [Clostridiales bacterium]|nr:hypothetical protein [Clostridiales bacterium]
MDYRFSPEQQYNPRRCPWMEQASLALGVFSLFGACFAPAMLAAPLSIVFALLSRGGEMTLSVRSKIGLILGIISLVCILFLFTLTFAMILTYYGSLSAIPSDYTQILQDMERLTNSYLNSNF